MSMVKAYHGKKCSELQLCCSTWSATTNLPRDPLTRDIQMEEDETWCWESSPTCTEDKPESWSDGENPKCVPLEPPPEFQDSPSRQSLSSSSYSSSLDKYACNFVRKLISDACLASSKITWSIPCSRECHMSESVPPNNNSSSWNGFRLCWTPELLPSKRLSSLSASYNSLSTVSSSNLDDSSYIKSSVSHDVLTTKQICDMYNVPFDSDIYAVPVDVVQGKDENRRSEKSRSSQRKNRSGKSKSMDEPIHVTVEEVRQYLHTLYSNDSEKKEEKKNSLQNGVNHKTKPNHVKSKKTKENVESTGNKSKKYRPSFSTNFKETLCNIFRIKKLPSPDQCLGKKDVGGKSDDIGMRLSEHESHNPPSPISKPPFSKRALPPLPKAKDNPGGTTATDPTPVPSSEEIPSPPPPPPPPLPPPFRSREEPLCVDFASSIEKVKDYGWYWGPISGEAAEKILSNEPDGSFIVRDSSDDYYIFSLTFKLNSIIRHVRIEHDKGNFSFGCSTRFKSNTIVDFIESAVEHSRSGRYLFFLHRRPVLGPMRVQLLHPVSRFKQVQSLQHMCRFVILKMVRKDLIPYLPLPRRVLDYLSTQHYYAEDVLEESSSQEELDQILSCQPEVFS